jgi:catechol 2,3-dioxygenase-like lactoylglutathione lyase family enzyme
MSEALRLARIVLICEDAASLAAFYGRAFGFAYRDGPKADPGLAALIGVAGAAAEVTVLRLGDELIALAQTLPRGRPYPADVAGWNPLFQHFAIVVSDMAAAYTALQAISGWTPISTDGPQVLPPSSGGVTAYKFRDPEGHPLELLAYPAGTVPAHWADPAHRAGGPCLGIDHSAISVADTERSVAFYGGLGLKRIASSLNQGIEQEKLDGICSPIVEVTAMAPAAQSRPHLELLCYRGRFPRSQSLAQPNDVASTRLVFDVASPLECAPLTAPRNTLPSDSATSQPGSICMLRDPDGHLISLEIPQGEICRQIR